MEFCKGWGCWVWCHTAMFRDNISERRFSRDLWVGIWMEASVDIPESACPTLLVMTFCTLQPGLVFRSVVSRILLARTNE